jgi:hypothetical protein
VHEGEVIGKVGNYQRRERATTYHLHFDMQVPTKYGWVFVNPYMTLVAAYERAINARGRELAPDGTPIAAGSTPLPAPAAALGSLPAALGPLRAPVPAIGGIPAPAANPIEIELQSDVIHRILSETAGNARPRRTADPY